MQGPPGSGKTWNGARMAIALMKARRRIGITALSHKAIHKFLEDVENASHESGFTFRGMKKCSSEESRYEGLGLVENTESNEAMLDPELQLIAGTSFLFAREEAATSAQMLPRTVRRRFQQGFQTFQRDNLQLAPRTNSGDAAVDPKPTPKDRRKP